MTGQRRVTRTILALLLMTLVTLGLLEAFLWFIDPLGLATYVYNQNRIVTIANAEGYTLAAGRYEMRGWSFTIDAEGNRVMPPSAGGCDIRFIGDSVTFGESVNDDATFAYQTALAHPQARFANEAKMGYNLGNILHIAESTPADGYIYLLMRNDADLPWARPPEEWGQRRTLPPRLSAFRYYLSTLQEIQSAPIPPDMEGFWYGFEVLNRRDDVLIIALDSPLAQQVTARDPSIPRIPWYPQRVSWIDEHPTAEGHAFIREQIAPHVEAFIVQQCSGIPSDSLRVMNPDGTPRGR